MSALPTIRSSTGEPSLAPATSARTGDVAGADREPVHRRGGEVGDVGLGDEVGREHASLGLLQRELERLEGRDLREDPLARLLDGHEPLIRSVRVSVGHGPPV